MPKIDISCDSRRIGPFDLPVYDARRAAEPPALDGWLESPCWRGADWVGRFRVVGTGDPAPKATRAAMLWDDDYLYIAIFCEEPRLSHARAEARVPEEVWRDDCVEIHLDPGAPDQLSFDIAVNILGRVSPAIKVPDGHLTCGAYHFAPPDGIRAAVRYTGAGWQAELAVPFGAFGLARPAAGDSWGAAIYRNDRMENAYCVWSPALPDGAAEFVPPSGSQDPKLRPRARFSAAPAYAAAAPSKRPTAWPAKPRFAMRGFMYDTSRGSIVYAPDYWKRRLPMLRELGFNTLLMYFENHLRYPSHPEFAPDGSWTIEGLRGLQDAAAEYGIDVIPAQTSLGHCPGILMHPAYRHLAEEGSDGYQFCPSHPDTPRMLADIFADLARASRSPYVSINADESAHLGLCPRCREAYAGWSKGRIFREHILKLHAVLKAHGKRMMMWDDMLWAFPEAVEGLPRDIVLLDWHYGYDKSYPSVDAWRELGFEVVVCPSMTRIENTMWIADYGAARGAMGLINTLWEKHTQPFGFHWRALLATAWAACGCAPEDVPAWSAEAAVRLFGPAAARMGHLLAAHDKAGLHGYMKGHGACEAVRRAITRQIVEEAEHVLSVTAASPDWRDLLEEFLYGWRIAVLEADVRAADGDATALRVRLDALKADGLARWERQSPLPSQRESFLERFTRLENAHRTKDGAK